MAPSVIWKAQDQLPQINHFWLATRGRSIQMGQQETLSPRSWLLYPAYGRSPLGSWPSWIIRARSISFASRPRRPEGPPDHERAGETFSPSPLSDSQTSAGKPTPIMSVIALLIAPPAFLILRKLIRRVRAITQTQFIRIMQIIETLQESVQVSPPTLRAVRRRSTAGPSHSAKWAGRSTACV